MHLVSRIRKRLRPLVPIPTGSEESTAPLPNLRAVIADIYGTLFVSGSGDIGVAAATDNHIALVESLHAAGLPGDAAQVEDWVAAVRASHADARGRGIAHPEVDVRTIWREVVSTPVTREQIDVLAVEYECRVNPVWPMPGLADVLTILRQRGLLLGIVSNAQFYTPLLFEACLGQPHPRLGFADPLCVWSYRQREAKPAPGMFAPVVEELHRLGIPPEQAVYVGNDMLNDIRTASRAGFRTCLFAGDRRSLRLREDDDRCRGLHPDRVITTLHQLTGIAT